ncbi:RNA polymerase sigma factor [Paenibacillus aceti]|uniref:RNA polymerase sigma factor n=1 Tax=Paenibacillus aceti TaxID=1820010 RepID=UPI001E5F5FE6|nr:RNA polymerase sigma factor [Paenibacillus aceti]
MFEKYAGVACVAYVYYMEKEGRKIGEKDELHFIQQLRQGDREAFRELVQTYRNHVYRVAYSVLHDEQEAEDAAQETFLQIYKSLSEYREQGFKTWLTRIALHKAIDLKRKRERRKEQQGDVMEIASYMSAPSEHVLKGLLDEEQRQELRQKIEELPAGHQTIITAFYLQGKSYGQIAMELNIAEKTVESKLYRARMWMREHWKEEDW